MAGGKETPRAKMIGMMYLVLTALLALQVSNAVLEKFAIMNETMQQLIHDGTRKSEETLTAIIDAAGKSQTPKVVHAKENAQKVRDLTNSTLKSIEDLKKEIMTVAGATEVNEAFINDHSSKVATMMIDPNKGVGKNYEKLLNDYVKQLNELTGVTPPFEKIAKPPKEMPLFATDDDHSRKDFLTFTFENTPPIAALASVTQVQTEILEYEARALDKLKADAEATSLRLDKFVPMVKAVSQRVAAGAKYEAQLFLTGSSTAFTPEFYKDGQKLQAVEEFGVKMGKIEFTASGGGYTNGIAKKQFKAEIKMNDTTFTQMIDYEVAEPVIKVTTGNAPTLYMNCGNLVTIEVPSLGTNFNPSYNPDGAEVVKGDKPGKVYIIPNQRKIKVGVSNGGTYIGNAAFEVKNIPEPRFTAYVGSTPVDLRRGIKATELRSLRIQADADENFKEEVPKDARFVIKSMQVQMGSGATAKAQMTAQNGSPDLGAWSGQARPGDRVVFIIQDAVRRTFKDTEEKVAIKASNSVVSIEIK